MEIGELKVKITADNQEFVKGVDESQKKADEFYESTIGTVNKTSENAIYAANIAVAAIGAAFVALTVESVKAFGEAESAVRRLEAVAESRGVGAGAVESLKDLAQATQDLTGASADLTTQYAAELLAQGKSQAQIERMIKVARDLSAVTGQSLTASMQSLNNSLAGQARELGRMIPEIRDLTEEQLRNGAAIDIIAEKYNGLAATMTDTVEVSNAVLAETFGDLAEAFGELMAPAVLAVNEALTEMAKVGMAVLGAINGMPGPVKTVIGLLVAMTSATIAAAVASALLNTAKVKETVTGITTVARMTAETIARWANYAATLAQAAAQAALNPTILIGIGAAVALTAAVIATTSAMTSGAGAVQEFGRSNAITTREVKALAAEMGIAEEAVRRYAATAKFLGATGPEDIKKLHDEFKDYQDVIKQTDIELAALKVDLLATAAATGGDLKTSIVAVAKAYKVPVDYVAQVALTTDEIIGLNREQAAGIYKIAAAYQATTTAVKSWEIGQQQSEATRIAGQEKFNEWKKAEILAKVESGKITAKQAEVEIRALSKVKEWTDKAIAEAGEIQKRRDKEIADKRAREAQAAKEKAAKELADLKESLRVYTLTEEEKLKEKYDADKKKLESDKNNKDSLLALEQKYQDDLKALKDKEAEDAKKIEKEGQDERLKILLKELEGYEINTEAARDAAKERVKASNLGKEEEEKQLKELDKKYKESMEARTKLVLEYAQMATQALSQIGSALSGFLQADTDRQIAELDRQMQARLEAEGLAEETKLQRLEREYQAAVEKGDLETAAEKEKSIKRLKIEEEFAKKKADIEYKNALNQWSIQIGQAVVAGAQAIMSIWGQWGWNPAVAGVLTGVAAAVTGVQVATIATNKPQPPKLWTGTTNPIAEAGRFIVGDQGPEIVNLPRGASVLNNRDTMNEIGSQQMPMNATIQVIMNREIIANSTVDLINNGIVRLELA